MLSSANPEHSDSGDQSAA